MTPEELRLCRDKLLPLHDFWHRDVYPLRVLAEFERKAGEIVGLLRAAYGVERENEFARLAFLSIAGLVTTTSLLAGAMERLAREPQLQERLRAEPALLNGFIDEVLRFEPPARRMMSRSSAKESSLSGTTVPSHARMDVDLARVHRDPHAFADPDRFDITRKNPPLLVFGSGAHACVGAVLARLEARTLLTRLLRCFDVSPGGPARRTEHRDFLGYESLPLRFTKRSAR
jgi:nocardicin N-oxygenase